MKRTQILLTEEQHKLLKGISKEKNISMAEAVRECVTYYSANISDQVVISEEEKYTRALNAAGRFKSGIEDLSSNHDGYLREDFEK
jgi:predicted DNA-binding protein